MLSKRTSAILSRRNPDSEKGFALVAAVLACLILLALAMLVIHLSTQDLRISTKVVGEKKAMAAAETGIHRLIQNFNPTNLAASAVPAPGLAVDAVNAPGDFYTIGIPIPYPVGRICPPPFGEELGKWTQNCYSVDVTGSNTSYSTKAEITVGIGYLVPVE